MCNKLLAVIFGIVLTATAGPQPNWGNNYLTRDLQREQSVQEEQARALFPAPPLQPVQPPNLWREIGGVTNYLPGPGWKDYYLPTAQNQWVLEGCKPRLRPGWYEFAGKVAAVMPDGIQVRGFSAYWGNEPGWKLFFVKNYPYEVAAGDKITCQAAKEGGLYTFRQVSGGVGTIHAFDYGHICDPPIAAPPTEDQIKDAQARATKKKAEAAAGALKFNQELAASGDAYGELRMGERYRDGDGVAKDAQKARAWFQKAAAQGDKAAASELADLDR